MATPLRPPLAPALDASPLRWDGRRLTVLDQTALPAEERLLELSGSDEVAEAIARLAVRGAPLIGIAAAYGLAMEAARDPADVDSAAERLRAARPTAVNLAWAVERVRAAARAGGAEAARAEAERIHAEDEAASAAMARHGADLLAGSRRVLTHCNTGALAAGGRGTALGVIAELAARDPGVAVLACEARPLLQGARLTVWELRRLGIAHELVVDAAAPGLIRRGEVDAVITGTDRVAANGDVANKVGTYGLALAARAAAIPFVVAGPISSIDAAAPSGESVEIEERSPDEVRHAGGALLTVPGTPCRNPAFDITPAELVTALVTERGVASPVTGATVAVLLAR
jgi:methylthioribose-1-phosphate isomerase